MLMRVRLGPQTHVSALLCGALRACQVSSSRQPVLLCVCISVRHQLVCWNVTQLGDQLFAVGFCAQQ
jgi:hypothetical protein